MSDDMKIHKYLLERAESINRYSDALRENLLVFDKTLMFLQAGVEVIDTVTLYHAPDETLSWVWMFNNDGLSFAARDYENEIVRSNEGTVREVYQISNAPRTLLKKAVQRLPAFLLLILDGLKKEEKIMAKAARASEKITKVVSSLGAD